MSKPLSEMTYDERRKIPGLSIYAQLYGETEDEVRNRFIHTMHEYGVYAICAQYSGGHDEGGIDDFDYVQDKNGDEVSFDGKTATQLDWDHPFRRACEDVLTTKFFSWALGASVYGTFNFDMHKRRVWTEGSIEEYVDDQTPIDWRL
jgi:hypothetical protein